MLRSMLGLFKNKLVIALIAFLGLGGTGAWFGSGYLGQLLPQWTGASAAETGDPGSAEGKLADSNTGSTVSGTTPVSSTTGSIAGQRPLMIGTFNIQKFGESKLGKADVVARLQELALPFDVLAIQEVVSQDVAVIKSFVTELNTNYNVKFNYVTSPWLGDTSYKERYAFIYDSSRVKLVEQPFVVADPENKMHREPLVARFQVRNESEDGTTPFSFVIVNVHTDPDQAAAEMDHISDVINYLEKSFAGTEDDILVVGDFNLDPTKVKTETKFSARTDWDSILGPAVMTNTASNKSYDNILYRPDATEEYLGRSGVINLTAKFKITADQAKEISDHMPVWAAFALSETQKTQIAAASSTTTR